MPSGLDSESELSEDLCFLEVHGAEQGSSLRGHANCKLQFFAFVINFDDAVTEE